MREQELLEIANEVSEHFNELVIDAGGSIARLIGCAGNDSDFYWMYCYRYGTPQRPGNQVIYSSMVGNHVYLKDKLNYRDYEDLDRVMTLNGCEKADICEIWKRI